MFQVIYAHEWLNNAHVHEMQVQLCKPITRGVTPAAGHRGQGAATGCVCACGARAYVHTVAVCVRVCVWVRPA